jgi:hypothetical protein
MAPVAEHWPSKHKTQSSTPVVLKKKKKKKGVKPSLVYWLMSIILALWIPK